MWGNWFTWIIGAVVVVAVLMGLTVLGSPILAVLISLAFVVAIGGFFFAGRTRQHASGAGTGSGAAGRKAYEGGPAPRPRSGGAPASGEGEAGAGETASRP